MGNNAKLTLQLFITLFALTVTQAAIPSYIKICHRKDPDLGLCITESIYALLPKLKDGIKEINAPAIEPLPLDTVKLRSGPNQAQINCDISNLLVSGVSSFKITELKADIPNKNFFAKVELPSLSFKGDYDMDMNILLLKYKGKGAITGNFSNYKLELDFPYQIVKKDDGKEYMQFDKLKLKLELGVSKLHLGDMDETLGRGVNEVVSDNADMFMVEVRPALENGLGERLSEIANEITGSFSYEELFPE